MTDLRGCLFSTDETEAWRRAGGSAWVAVCGVVIPTQYNVERHLNVAAWPEWKYLPRRLVSVSVCVCVFQQVLQQQQQAAAWEEVKKRKAKKQTSRIECGDYYSLSLTPCRSKYHLPDCHVYNYDE